MNLPNKLTIYFDGACDKPGGIATYGWTIHEFDNIQLLAKGSGEECRGEGATNNVAEYAALRNALAYLKGREWRGEVFIRGDSKLVINQLMSEWDCNKPHLIRLRRQCWDLLEQIAEVWAAEWVPREKNEHCDELSKTDRPKKKKAKKPVINESFEDDTFEWWDIF